MPGAKSPVLYRRRLCFTLSLDGECSILQTYSMPPPPINLHRPMLLARQARQLNEAAYIANSLSPLRGLGLAGSGPTTAKNAIRSQLGKREREREERERRRANCSLARIETRLLTGLKEELKGVPSILYVFIGRLLLSPLLSFLHTLTAFDKDPNMTTIRLTDGRTDGLAG